MWSFHILIGFAVITIIIAAEIPTVPPRWTLVPTDKVLVPGSNAKLECRADGSPKPRIVWKKSVGEAPGEYKELRSEGNVRVDEGTLYIENIQKNDEGHYLCEATNGIGSDLSIVISISLNLVQKVPETPSAWRVLYKTNQTVRLGLTKPQDANSPLKQYIIEFKMANGSWEHNANRKLISNNSIEATVEGLSPITAYNFRIFAENEIGTSDPSEVISVITTVGEPTVKPQDVKVGSDSPRSMRVTWKMPPKSEWSGEILGFYVSCYECPNYSEIVPYSSEVGKEYSVEITNLQPLILYSISVYAYNSAGLGPWSDAVTHTVVGTSENAPREVNCKVLTSHTIFVSWTETSTSSGAVPVDAYKIIYAASELWHDEHERKIVDNIDTWETYLQGLKKFTDYTLQVVAITNNTDSVPSFPISCRTDQDVPEAPADVKALVNGKPTILLSWRPPIRMNGVPLPYTVYWREKGSKTEPKKEKVQPNETSFEVFALEMNKPYEFWVTASTILGESHRSKVVIATPSDDVSARIVSFGDTFTVKSTAEIEQSVKLPCRAIGSPTPNIAWKVNGVDLVPNERIQILEQGSLFFSNVIPQDAGEYTCFAANSMGKDSITHKLIVLAPLRPPQVKIIATTHDSITLKLEPHEMDTAPILSYTLHRKLDSGVWVTDKVAADAQNYTITSLPCGQGQLLYATAYNSIGTSEISDIINTRTNGSKPIMPESSTFIEPTSNSVKLHLGSWKDGGCRIHHFDIEHKKMDANEWNTDSNNINVSGNLVVLDLEPATRYNFRIKAHNTAGSTVANYEYVTMRQ